MPEAPSNIEKIRAQAARFGKPIPLYLMTSPVTHQEQVEFLAQHHRFGLAEDDLFVFCQGTMPAVDAKTGQLLLEAKDSLFLSPDGGHHRRSNYARRIFQPAADGRYPGGTRQAGKRILVIDFDPQGNASTALSIPHTSGTPGIYDVIIDGAPLAEVVQPCPQVSGLWCAPATIDLAGAEIELVSVVARESRLTRAIAAYPAEYDYLLIDCPPSLGLLTVNALVAAREVLIPIQCEYYALEGLTQLMKNVELIRRHLNADLQISTILLTMYDGRTRLASDVAEQVREYFGDRVLRTAIPRSVRISEAPSHGETVMTYDPGSAGALSYAEAAAEMRRQEG